MKLVAPLVNGLRDGGADAAALVAQQREETDRGATQLAARWKDLCPCSLKVCHHEFAAAPPTLYFATIGVTPLLPHTPEPSIAHSRPLIDYLYYEIITFTTVGYGDIIPSTAQGKLFAMCTALLGATHGVTFVAIVLLALTQHPPAKNQDELNDHR